MRSEDSTATCDKSQKMSMAGLFVFGKERRDLSSPSPSSTSGGMRTICTTSLLGHGVASVASTIAPTYGCNNV